MILYKGNNFSQLSYLWVFLFILKFGCQICTLNKNNDVLINISYNI